MEHVLNAIFSPLKPPNRCLAHRFYTAVGLEDHVKSPTSLTATQGAIIIAIISLLFAGAMEFAGRTAPAWMTDNIKLVVAFLLGVAVPAAINKGATNGNSQGP